MDKYISRKIRQEIRKLLIFEWDPIGVRDVPEAHDEYDLYVGDIFVLIDGGANNEQIADHLHEIETDRMGIPRVSSRADLIDLSKKLSEAYWSTRKDDGV
jgi:hypothetical protein